MKERHFDTYAFVTQIVSIRFSIVLVAIHNLHVY